MKNIRLLQLVVIAGLFLLAFKAFGLVFQAPTLFGSSSKAEAQKVDVEAEKALSRSQDQQSPSVQGQSVQKQSAQNKSPSEVTPQQEQSGQQAVRATKGALQDVTGSVTQQENSAQASDSDTEFTGSVFDENFINNALPPQISLLPGNSVLSENTDTSLITGSVEGDNANQTAGQEQEGQGQTNIAQGDASGQTPDGQAQTQGAGQDGQQNPAQSPTQGQQSPVTKGPEARPTKSEFAVLQSLSERRKELDARARQLDLQRNLLKAAEKRVESRIAELKSIETRIRDAMKKQEEVQSAQYGKLVSIYSKMKPAQAARIFNRLDVKILLGLVQRIKPKTMSPILAAMDPAQVERITLEMASQAQDANAANKALPKINSN